MKNNSVYREWIKPIVVLVAICVIVAGALSATNAITAPIIEQNKKAEADATRAEVLPAATSFTEIPVEIENVLSVHRDDGGAGYVIAAATQGYGGTVTVTLGINTGGEIVAMKIDASSETTGIGTRAAEQSHIEKFIGPVGSARNVDTISGATVSSTAVKKAVSAAIDAYEQVSGAPSTNTGEIIPDAESGATDADSGATNNDTDSPLPEPQGPSGAAGDFGPIL